ncbi:MAG: DUF2834 domain-containing protein [Candidatus Acidiferrales bacterium]
MSARHLYLGLCVLGTVLPYWQFIPFLREQGWAPRLFLEQLFANPVSGLFGMDVLVSSLVLWVLVAVEGRRAGVKHLWAPVVANLAVGVSLGLPMFLYMREVAQEKRDSVKE